MGNDRLDRRTFLKMGGLLAAAGVTIPAASQIFAPSGLASSGRESSTASDVSWTMVADVSKCSPDCTICEEACADENNLPRYPGNLSRYDPYWLRIIEAKKEISGVDNKALSLPVMCMMCENPPCTHVCPTKASFIRPDGLVMIDEHRCIGCRYCVIACPYRVRFMIFKDIPDDQWTNRKVPKLMRGVASKCTFCVHRIDDGKLPRCVVDCPEKALTFGDRNDPETKVAQLLEPGTAQVLRPNLRVGPNVFYLGL